MALSPDLVEIATRQQVLLEGLKQHEVEKFTPFLLQIDSAIRDKLTRDEVTSLSRQRLEALLAEIESALKAIYAGYTVQLTADLADIAQHQAEFEGKALDSVTTADWSATLPTLDRLKAVVEATPLSVHGADGGKMFADVVSDWTASEIDSVTGSIRKGYFQGNTTQQIVQAIRGTRAKNYADGLLDVTSRNAEAIVRTGVQHVANAARFNVWEQNADLVQGYVWISVLDLKTTVICRSLDGQVFKIGKGPIPPAHWRCRSTTAASLNRDFKFLLPGATRASADGQVKADLNYYDWLKTQSKAFQDQVLGPTRAQLFRDGGLSAQRFADLQLDRKFDPLTLDEMRRLEPLAFARAGLE